jgi:hypothetical protein
MRYKVVKYKPKRKFKFKTYKPEKKIDFSKEEVESWLVRIGHGFVFLGGLIEFWAVSILMILKISFSAEKKVKESIRRLSFNNKVVEFRIKKKN